MCDHSNESFGAVLSHGSDDVQVRTVDETIVCDHSNENFGAALSGGTIKCFVL